MSKIKTIEPITSIPIKDDEYVKLVSHISDLWDDARNKAFQAVNTSLLMANWHTGEYIVEFEQFDLCSQNKIKTNPCRPATYHITMCEGI